MRSGTEVKVEMYERSRAYRKHVRQHDAIAQVINKVEQDFQENKYKFKQKDPLDQILNSQVQ